MAHVKEEGDGKFLDSKEVREKGSFEELDISLSAGEGSIENVQAIAAGRYMATFYESLPFPEPFPSPIAKP